jgi:methionyl-tRNA formyltransferase
VLRTDDINRESLPPADAMVVIAFGQKIGEEKVRHPTHGSINLHASILPKYRGAAPINWTIINGETVAGNSVIRLAPRMDAGAVLAQSQLPIELLETAGELHDRLAADGAPLVLRVLEDLSNGRAVETPQDESKATIAPKLSREATRLDWARPADELGRRIRGLYPWPGCRVRLCDAAGEEVARLRLVRARPAPDAGEAPRWEPGEIMSDGSVRAGDGGLELVEVQPDGRTPMSLADYRRGHRWMPGMRVESVIG